MANKLLSMISQSTCILSVKSSASSSSHKKKAQNWQEYCPGQALQSDVKLCSKCYNELLEIIIPPNSKDFGRIRYFCTQEYVNLIIILTCGRLTPQSFIFDADDSHTGVYSSTPSMILTLHVS